MMRTCYIVFGMIFMLIVLIAAVDKMDRGFYWIPLAIAFFWLAWTIEHKDKK